MIYQPTVLADVQTSMAISQEETFGPVAPLIVFDTDAEVLALANDTRSGLAAYLYTSSLSRIFHFMEGLEYGVLGINTGLVSNEVAPFGGVKESGLGREGSRHGIEEYLQIKYACIGGI
jgi:succinate-semialdehyde dehydrogenase/glutarate-semialdehyde dehydrogenase